MSEGQFRASAHNPADMRPVSHFMSVAVAVELPLARHEQEGTRKVIRQELMKSRRARSRRRFQFWAAVGSLIG